MEERTLKKKNHPNRCWDKIFWPRGETGLGIQKTKDVNAPFLTIQGWKVLAQANNIWIQIIKAKYILKIRRLPLKLGQSLLVRNTN